MYIQVCLLNGFSEPFLYEVPSDWSHHNLLFSLVKVPLKNKLMSGIVIQTIQKLPPTSFTIRKAHSFELFPADPHYIDYLKKLCAYYRIEMVQLISRIKHFLSEEITKSESSSDDRQEMPLKDITLTPEQQKVVDFGNSWLGKNIFAPTLLHGVTGSGKTEIYKQLIINTYSTNKTTLLLLPEVTLALQFEKLLRYQLPHIPLYGFHSGTSVKDKKIVWNKLLLQEPVVIMGVHLPALLPIANLGLIIVDEEHDTGYQEKKHPKINTKEAALLRAQTYKTPILLGSATPSISSLYNVKHKGWHFFELKKRFAGNFPQVQTVVLPEQKYRKQFWISTELEKAITDRLAKKEQVIIFLNRRGFSFFVQCKQCSFIFTCTQCSVSLTLHNDSSLTCHYCGHTKQLPLECTQCKAPESEFLKKGIGTQQVVTILEKLFPTARIARADLDVTAKKKSWKQTMLDFDVGNIDILVGTQTITKGYHFPKVTLVGIIWADLNLHFPLYNAAETCLQQLIQVAGRAGRSSEHSLVIAQTMIDHPIFNYINEVNYPAFYEHEIAARQLTGYPPAQRLAQIELKHANEAIIEREAQTLCNQLHALSGQLPLPVTILGPARPVVHMIKKTHMRAIYLKGADIHQLAQLFNACNKDWYSSSIFFTPNPLN
ncbi:MAG: replication restart helicase PriA [Candidatus Dependentiae bacterium]